MWCGNVRALSRYVENHDSPSLRDARRRLKSNGTDQNGNVNVRIKTRKRFFDSFAHFNGRVLARAPRANICFSSHSGARSVFVPLVGFINRWYPALEALKTA